MGVSWIAWKTKSTAAGPEVTKTQAGDGVGDDHATTGGARACAGGQALAMGSADGGHSGREWLPSDGTLGMPGVCGNAGPPWASRHQRQPAWSAVGAPESSALTQTMPVLVHTSTHWLRSVLCTIACDTVGRQAPHTRAHRVSQVIQ